MPAFARASVDNLVNNVPDSLKAARQFVVWDLKSGRKKVPRKPNGSAWGNYRDPQCWRTFNDAVEMVDRCKAFGIGLVLASDQEAVSLPHFNLIPGLVALDGDAKQSESARPLQVPENIFRYMRHLESYSEFSPSLKGVRSIAFGTLPTDKQNLRKILEGGTEISLYRSGWVTLTGLAIAESPPTIEHRQSALDQIVTELWPDLEVGAGAGDLQPLADLPRSDSFESAFVLDWARTTSEERIQQFIRGFNRTPEQLAAIRATWEMNRSWNHGGAPDNSMYTKRIVEEALWLRRHFRWNLQDVVDLVITFCKRNNLRWSFGRAKKQMADGLHYISTKTCQRVKRVVGAPTALRSTTTTTLLTCIEAQLIETRNHSQESFLTPSRQNNLDVAQTRHLRDTKGISGVNNESSLVSHEFARKSFARDSVITAISRFRGWVKPTTLAAKTAMSLAAVRKQLQRLTKAGLVDGDGYGRYRVHRIRERVLTPCCLKPFPKCRGTERERKTLSLTDLKRRGWPMRLIEQVFPQAGTDYIEKEISLDLPARTVNARFYWISRIRAAELEPWFETARQDHLRRERQSKQTRLKFKQ